MKVFVHMILASTAAYYSTPAASQTEFRSNAASGTIYINENHRAPGISRIIVFSGVHDVEVNEKIMNLFYDIGVRATNGFVLFPPLENYSEEDLINLSREKDFDALIWVDIKNRTSHRGTLRTQAELTLHDLRSNVRYARAFGYGISSITAPDKAVFKFFQGVIRKLDLQTTKSIAATQQ